MGTPTAMQRANATALHVDERPRHVKPTSQMTPARRAGLDALEREFSELLVAYQRQLDVQSAAA
jgi:hypothetical protein